MAAPAPLSPLAPKAYPALPPIAGVRFATVAAGVRYPGRTDVMMALFDEPAAAAGVFTRSKCPSAPVDWCRAQLGGGKARALIVNSGNANAFTGHKGIEAVEAIAAAAAKIIGAAPAEVFMASTGVIGEPLDGTRIARVLGELAREAKADGLMDAARAIMTTDTFPKVATAAVRLGDAEVTINGIAKGAGMIAPDMATMLSYVFTDAPIAAGALQTMLSKSVERSFNAITVDSDTSTSDTLMIFATGAAADARRTSRTPPTCAPPRSAARSTSSCATWRSRSCATARARASSSRSGSRARRPARRRNGSRMSIANSPLVKTACGGEDANWGRVVMAVGKAGEKAERDKLDVWFGKIRVAHRGLRDPAYDEATASAYMKRDSIVITADLHIGRGRAIVWTCDLTKEYVAINGDYRS